jgi:hypothetical protein
MTPNTSIDTSPTPRYRNKKTGTVYVSVEFYKTKPLATVQTEAGSRYIVKVWNLEEVASPAVRVDTSGELPKVLKDAIWTNAMSSQSAQLVETLAKQYVAQAVQRARIDELQMHQSHEPGVAGAIHMSRDEVYTRLATLSNTTKQETPE